MRNGGRIAAAIEVFGDVVNRHQPVKSAARDWGKRARYAGSKDRAWVSGLVLDALRKRLSIGHLMGDDSPRGVVLGALAHAWGWDIRQIDDAMDEPHAPSALTMTERERLVMAPDVTAAHCILGDFPEWLSPHMQRAFGEQALVEAQAMTVRASVDLRVNTLKTDAERASAPLRSVHAKPSELLINAFHIPAPDPAQREAALDRIPAYSKGWVEIQDAGSQIAAAAANLKPGESVLDFCAGGGGKTLAMAAAMEGKGQVYAYDIDGRRLSALIPRLKRSGAHNVQLVHPDTEGGLDPLKGSMDCVFIDAPCTGVGTWRRRPDSKWRLKPKALEARMQQQREILQTAAEFVKPGGRVIYVTCSFLNEEDEDQTTAFLAQNTTFKRGSTSDEARMSGLLTPDGDRICARYQSPDGEIKLTPLRSGTDGFFISVLHKAT